MNETKSLGIVIIGIIISQSWLLLVNLTQAQEI